jgi:hypothetical protein
MILVSVALVGVLAMAATAMAKEPTGDFAVFKQCPLSNPEVGKCLFSQSESGEFTIGNAKVPISKTITLQGGVIEVSEGVETFVAAANGESLSKTPQTVPGGLLGIIAPEGWPKWLQEIFNKFINEGALGVTATAEQAGTITINQTSLLFEFGTAVGLPTRIHLNNGLLGNNCYIGSKSSPVTFDLTTGTTNPPKPNTPIKGSRGEAEFKDEFNLLILKNNKLVDNAFSAPAASGCGSQLGFIGEFFIDLAVNAKLGLPSTAGHNTAILNGTIQVAAAEGVKGSEK